MKSKTSVLTTLALALTLATAVGAQGAVRNQGERSRGEQQDMAGRRGPRGPQGMLLRGITLTTEQRTKLAELQRRERAAWEANRPARPNGQNGRDGATARPRRERGDTTGFAARRAAMERRFEQRVTAIREILTPAQRTQFDKNVADAKANPRKGEGKFGKR